MRVGFVSVALLVWTLSPLAVQADEPEPSPACWGIATKKNLKKSRDTVLEETQSTPDPGTQAIAPMPSVKADTGTVPAGKPPTKAGEALGTASASTPTPEKQASTK